MDLTLIVAPTSATGITDMLYSTVGLLHFLGFPLKPMFKWFSGTTLGTLKIRSPVFGCRQRLDDPMQYVSLSVPLICMTFPVLRLTPDLRESLRGSQRGSFEWRLKSHSGSVLCPSRGSEFHPHGHKADASLNSSHLSAQSKSSHRR